MKAILPKIVFVVVYMAIAYSILIPSFKFILPKVVRKTLYLFLLFLVASVIATMIAKFVEKRILMV